MAVFKIARSNYNCRSCYFLCFSTTPCPSCDSSFPARARIQRPPSSLRFSKLECFRLLRKRGFPIPFQACGYVLDKMFKFNTTPVVTWGFLLEILDSGFPPNVYNFNILMHKMCKEGKIREAQAVFDEIGKRGLNPTVVSFNTLINGYCKSGNLEDGFKLKTDMERRTICPDKFTYSVLINGLCKEGRLDDANGLFDEMCGRGLVPMMSYLQL
ncbi:hypothetical protein M0R45_000572 [Rubus argutus]|uniref:Pentatricopeptide repeat-containing protein n=1 Tax=Rubus argutus TaxID=59490 RepID=A0AAW1VN14_RUBAR